MSTPEAAQERLDITTTALRTILKAIREDAADALEIVDAEAREALSAVGRLDMGAGR